MEEKTTDAERDCIELIKKYTKHRFVKITNRCNLAIFIALAIAKRFNTKKYIAIPEQGGWFSFRKYPKILGFDIIEIKTDSGIIIPEELENSLKEKNISAVLIASFAGYFAEQPLEEISKLCGKYNCLLIEDASGAIGDKKLCNGDFSDIIVASFGKHKPVNLGYGGFISANRKEFFESSSDFFSLIKVYPEIYRELYKKLKKAPERIDFFYEKCKEIKSDLKDFDIVHREKRGINVVVRYKNENERKSLIEYCEKNGYEFVLCPKYIRINDKAISIEVKRLNK